MRKILIATTNQGKVREIRKLFADQEFEVVGIDSYPQLGEVIEDGDSFRENALKKARDRAEKTGLLTLADDSGLEVEYLQGRPGIYSSRFAGEGATDAENNRKLLAVLKGVPRERRGARFRCVAAVVDPDRGQEFTTQGQLKGVITTSPAGKQGFGYDPLFYLPEYDKTVAQLASSEKNKISHRARALKKMKAILRRKL